MAMTKRLAALLALALVACGPTASTSPPATAATSVVGSGAQSVGTDGPPSPTTTNAGPASLAEPTTTMPEPVEQSGGALPAAPPSTARASSTVPANSIVNGPLPAAGESGLASWYETPWGGLTTASRDYPKGTRLRVCHGGACVGVLVNDYGPQAWTGRALDLSSDAFAALAPLSRGVIAVSWEVVA